MQVNTKGEIGSHSYRFPCPTSDLTKPKTPGGGGRVEPTVSALASPRGDPDAW